MTPSRNRRTAHATILVAALLSLCSASIAGPEPPLCAGQPATIYGTSESDVLTGTPGKDVIQGLRGKDRITGVGGDDLLCGGRGADVVRGGGGTDLVRGGRGQDRLAGGAADDELRGGGAMDYVSFAGASSGVDVDLDRGSAITNSQRDLLYSFEGAIGSDFGDVIRGSAQEEWLDAGGGRDRLYGRRGGDFLDGGDGRDALYGGRGNDGLSGGFGDQYQGHNAGDGVRDLLDGNKGYDSCVANGGDRTRHCESYIVE